MQDSSLLLNDMSTHCSSAETLEWFIAESVEF